MNQYHPINFCQPINEIHIYIGILAWSVGKSLFDLYEHLVFHGNIYKNLLYTIRNFH